ncbi:cyclase family protein [Pseudonocardia ailaonensis]|uniref:Cyclase family protein n=1 Tax=Pseudonocardia ailaonensis TaxID=367279 RepID=A0ABN2MZQ8_9PSEU
MTTTEGFVGEATIRDYIARFSNWGRWGADDELGTLNFVGPAQLKAAAGLVRQGKVVSMALPYDGAGPQTGGFRANPLNLMTATGTDYCNGDQDPLPGSWGPARGFGYADDVVVMPNQAGTQWDGLSHIFFEGKMYPGVDASRVTAKGAQHCGIQSLKNQFVMRGVLLDVARHQGVDALEPGYAIGPEDLDGTAAAQGVEIRSGDCIVIRTGFLGARRGNWGDYSGGAAPGMSLHSAPWLYEHEIAAMAADTWGLEVRPNQIELFQPLHVIALVHMGMPFGEVWDTEAIAADCAADGVYEFLLSATALPITGACGTPLNPVAVK